MNKGLKGLEERVLSKNFCISCGACLSLCPYLRSFQGRVVKLHDCNLDEGRCFAYCPKAEGGPKKVDSDGELGPVRCVLMVRAIDPFWREKAQAGGVVSALIDFALKSKAIDAAILTQRGDGSLPEGRIARNREDILACAGSGYVSGPTLETLNRGPWQGGEKIGLVGLPCQALALSKMKSSSLETETPVDRVEIVIGLFCTWAFEYERWNAFLKRRLGEARVGRQEITPPPERLMKVHTKDRVHAIPVDEIRGFIRNGCHVCPDMTAEHSDISAGTVEGIDGWNTVILRSERGEAFFKEAEAASVIETRPLPEGHLKHLREASLLKRQRASVAIQTRGESLKK